MDRGTVIGMTALVCVAALAGCGSLSDATPTSTPSVTTVNDRTGSVLPPNTIQFSRVPGTTIQLNDSGYYYQGSVWAELRDVGTTRFENATLCVYDENWAAIDTRDLGTFERGTQKVPVDIHTEETPHWLVVEHPDFRDQDVYARAFVRTRGQYNLTWRHELDAPALGEAGGCR